MIINDEDILVNLSVGDYPDTWLVMYTYHSLDLLARRDVDELFVAEIQPPRIVSKTTIIIILLESQCMN